MSTHNILKHNIGHFSSLVWVSALVKITMLRRYVLVEIILICGHTCIVRVAGLEEAFQRNRDEISNYQMVCVCVCYLLLICTHISDLGTINRSGRQAKELKQQGQCE